MADKVKVVISGASGVFPESESVDEFKENLFTKKDMTTLDNRRWNIDAFKGNSKLGKIKDLSKFDYLFFRIHRKHASSITPALRILLEKSYEAIFDAGCNPEELRNTKTGVYMAIGYNDWETILTDVNNKLTTIGEYQTHQAHGLSRSIIANRISYWLDLKGPSYTIDSACSSSIYAVEKAYQDISNGVCDAALVGGFSLCFLTCLSTSYGKSGVLSMTGLCRPFDEAADGFVRGEAIVMLFLQKKQNAKRIYANVIHVKTNCDGFKEEGITFPSGESHFNLYENFYKEINISPNSISFIETHGTGTQIGDIVEANAIEKFFCNDRKDAIKIGSVKSNMGHAEACAGLCGLVKLIIAFETGLIPPNINLQKLNPKIPAFYNGNIEVVTEAVPCIGEFFALNSFGIGGANGHILLSPHTKDKVCKDSNLKLPQLVLVSGRTEEAVDVLASDLEENHCDLEYVNLMREVFHNNIEGHSYRGYFLKPDREEAIKITQNIHEEKRPVWFVFTGMGCQWPGMGKDLLKIPIFAESIDRSHKFLKSKNLDLMKIITEEDPHIFDNVLNSFVAIAAMQIALVDTLNALEVVPDGIVGHSLGEIGCGYASGCLTAEQTLLSSYSRGLVSISHNLAKGLMAVIGLPYNDLKDSLPPEIDIACHNTETNYTISGPTDIVKEYVKNMQSKGVWVRPVNSSGIAYHSRYVESAGLKLLSHLEKIIPNPKPRPENWICTSALEDQWQTEKVKYASAEYYTNNLISSVYLKQTSKYFPDNALVIEIAPHGLLQAILKQLLPSSVENIPLTLKNHNDNVTFFLNAIGKIYINGFNPKIKYLYPPIEFPVSKKTPMLAPLVRWQHDEDWFVPYGDDNSVKSGERTFTVDVKSEEYEYLKGHMINDRNIFPGVEYLNLIWQSIANIYGKPLTETAVIFEEVRFLRATYISEKELQMHTSIQLGSGNFEVTENDAVAVQGRVRILEDYDENDVSICDWNTFPKVELLMKTKDIYKVLRLKGFQYQGHFRNLISASSEGTFGKLGWDNNFVTFMDSLAHLKLLTQDTSELNLPTYVQKAVIDPVKHFKILNSLNGEKPEFLAYYDKNWSALQSGGVQMFGMKFTSISRKKDMKDVVLEKYQFVPYFNDEKSDLNSVIRMCTHIIIENLQILKIRSVELLNEPKNVDKLISNQILSVLGDWPLIQGDVSVLMENECDVKLENSKEIKLLQGKLPTKNNLSVVIITDILTQKERLPEFLDALRENGFIISREHIKFDEGSLKNLNLEICFCRNIGDEKILLLRKKHKTHMDVPPIAIKTNNFFLHSWISEVKNAIEQIDTKKDQKLVLYAEEETCSGILGFFNCIRKEYGDDIFRCFFIMDKNAPKFSFENSLYKSQFLKNLSHNVYKNGKWGSYRHSVLEKSDMKKSIHACAAVTMRGDLSTLKWLEGPINPISSCNEEDSLIHVYYAALNFRDIVFATGKVSVLDIYNSRIAEQNCLGFEVAGKNVKGERLMGITLETNSITSLVYGDSHMLWKVPDDMTLEEAASIPSAYATAFLALLVHGQLQRGQSVLIHAGSGGVGMACIYICIHYKCNIFTTVGTPQKKEFIRKKFPQIPEAQIGNSRNTCFEKMIMRQTKGKGVDLLVNSLADDKFHASLRCVAVRGKFLEIGKYDMSKHTFIDSHNFLKAVSYHSVMLDLFINASTEDRIMFRDQMQELINSGVMKPLERTVFAPKDLETAMRYMAAGKHIGKVIIKIRDEENDIKCKPQPFYMDAYPRVICRKNQVYIIIGGLGGFGLELADWLILRRARIIILNSRTGIKNGYQVFKTEQWKSYGVKVLINTDDATTETGVKSLLNLANSLGPVTGIFNLAALLRDKPFVEQTIDTFMESAGPKAIATIHLDQISRLMCPNLEYFVVFSSVSCGRGNISQTNYGMYNSVMERICETRKEDNLPALAIQWGAVGDVGLVADMAEDNKTVVIGGTLQQKINSCLETLDLFLKQKNPIVASMIVAEKHRPCSNVVNVAANILGIKDFKSVSLNWTLPQLGMDSMMATELKQILESEFEIFLTQKDIKSLTFNKLHDMVKNDKRRQTVMLDAQIPNSQIKKFNGSNLDSPIIRLPSLMDNGSTKEVDPLNNHTIFVFPGQEGFSNNMEPMGKNFTAQLLCLQYYFAAPYETIASLAEKIIPHITKRSSRDNPFQMIAYSFGTSVCIEVVKILEKEGYQGKIWFIDGSPLYNEMHFSKYYSNSSLNENETQTRVILKLLKTIAPSHLNEEFLNELKARSGWESKLEIVSPVLSNYVKDDRTLQLLHNYLHFHVVRPRSNSEPVNQTLNSKAILIRSSEKVYKIAEDYELSKYFEAPLQLYRVDADHSSIFKDERIAEIIAKDLEPL